MHDIRAEFQAAYSKFAGRAALQALLKRDVKEMEERMGTYREAKKTVEDINDNPSSTFSAAINKLSVMTKAEQNAMYARNASRLLAMATRGEGVRLTNNRVHTPSSIDWVDRGAQPAVKDQGSCGSCWAFAAVSAIEGRYYALTGDQEEFSEQELLDGK